MSSLHGVPSIPGIHVLVPFSRKISPIKNAVNSAPDLLHFHLVVISITLTVTGVRVFEAHTFQMWNVVPFHKSRHLSVLVMCCLVVTSCYILSPQQPFKVRALRSGMVLVVDEADKAPTHVTCILKNIVEGGEIITCMCMVCVV